MYYFSGMETNVISMKLSDDFLQFIDSQAIKKKLPRTTYMKAVIAKATKYRKPKEKAIV